MEDYANYASNNTAGVEENDGDDNSDCGSEDAAIVAHAEVERTLDEQDAEAQYVNDDVAADDAAASEAVRHFGADGINLMKQSGLLANDPTIDGATLTELWKLATNHTVNFTREQSMHMMAQREIEQQQDQLNLWFTTIEQHLIVRCGRDWKMRLSSAAKKTWLTDCASTGE